MKRRISLLLAVVMILGSFSFVFAAEESVEAKAGEFLKKVDVLEGINGDLKLGDNLRRQDMVVLISRLMGEEDAAAKFPVEGLTFKDFNDPYYKPIIAWAVSNKLIEGHTPERFGFNENVTAQDYATVLLRALGYEVNDENYAKVLEEAKELGLLEDVEVENGTALTRGQMAVMTFNALGTNMKDSEKTLAEKLGIEMPAPEKLEVEEVKADNLKEIVVKFNKAVDRDNVEDRDIYTTNAGSIKDARLMEDNSVILTLEGEMKNNKGYKLNIRGLVEGDAAVNSEFKFTAKDNAVPEVVEVVGLGTKAVKVAMSEPVKNVKSSSFKVDGKSYYGSVSVAGRDIILKPYGSDFGVGEHTLVVKSLEDYAGFKSIEREVKFEIVEDKEAPTVVEIKGTMERIVVTFSEAVDDATVSKDSVYWGGVKSNKADKVVRLSGDRFAFEFSGSKTLPTYETVVTVKGVKDYSGNEMKAEEIPFKATIDQTRPEVIDVDVDTKEIEVKFNKGLNKDDATAKKNYTITDEDDKKVSIKSLELSADSRTVTIGLYSDLKENKDYTLEITGIRDNTKLANTILPYKETISAGNYSRPKVTAITVGSKNETIHISFNKKMDVETISNPANYMLAHIDGTRYALDAIDGDVDVIQDGKAVILELPEKINKVKVSTLKFGSETDEDDKYVEDYDIVGVILSASIQDTAENRVKDYGTVRPFAKDDVKVENAEVTDKRTIELEFTHPIEYARISDFDAKGFNIDEVKVDGTVDVVIKTTKDLDAGLQDDDNSEIGLSIVDDNKIETILDLEVGKQNIKLTDKIKPTLIEAVGTVNKGETVLTLTLKFDEALAHEYGELAKRDLAIKVAGGKSIDMSSKDDVQSSIVEGSKNVTIVIKQKDVISKDNEYEIEVINPSAIRDKNNNNVVNKTDGAIVAEKITVVESDDEKVAIAKENLNLGDINAVTEDLTLPGTQDGAAVSWVSSDEDIIATDGTVTRPAVGEQDATVTLTATITVGDAKDTKTFEVTVLANEPTDVQKVAKAKANLDLGDISAVTEKLTLPGTQDGAAVSWVSSDEDIIATDGTVTRPAVGEQDATVTLTAIITAGDVKDIKTFEVTVKAEQ